MHKLAKKGVRRFFVNNVLRRVVAGAPLDVRLYPRAALRAPGGWRYALNGTETRRWSDRRELFLCECIGYMDRGDRSKMLDKLAAAGFERCARRGRCEPLAGGVGNGVGTGRFAKRGWKVVGAAAARLSFRRGTATPRPRRFDVFATPRPRRFDAVPRRRGRDASGFEAGAARRVRPAGTLVDMATTAKFALRVRPRPIVPHGIAASQPIVSTEHPRRSRGVAATRWLSEHAPAP